MSRLVILNILCWIVTFSAQAQKDPLALHYSQSITPESLSEYLYVLASDSLEGREAGTTGQKKAADYLKSKFESFGLKAIVPNGKDSSYFQQFDLVNKSWKDVYLKIGKTKKIFLQDFYAYGDVEIAEEEKLPIVFGGYGIESQNYSDYKNLDVNGKGVVLFMGEPFADGKSLITGTNTSSDWANDWRKKTATARKKGAKAVFIVVGKTQKEFESRLAKLKPHLVEPMVGFTHKQSETGAFFVPVAMAAEMLKTKEEKLIDAQSKLGVQSVSFRSAKVWIKAAMTRSVFQTENVLGFLEGKSRKDEVIVITAHYDHLGRKGDEIFYGADDDGSGTAAVVALAKAFSQAKKEGNQPERSILFMPVTAEEKGLMGSEYYTDKPVIPLANTVANLNIDMIGRVDAAHTTPHYVYLIGSDKLSTTLHKVSSDASNLYIPDIELDYTFNRKDDPNRFYYRSDHYNFAKNNIPVIFYFNGVHEDYHKATDTVEKIDFDKVSLITKLIFFTAWELANLDRAIEVDVKGE